MKRTGGLFEQIVDRRNLSWAANRAAQGKRERPEVRDFFANFGCHATEIIGGLQNGTFRFSPYRVFPIRDPKSRTIHAPTFRDRVVHHLIIAATGPVFERGAIQHSYACRAGYGQHAALTQAAQWTRNNEWYLKLDVSKYYDSIPHSLLRTQLARRFRERRVLWIFDRLLDSYSQLPGKGLPIGALTSQYLGNFYLDEFDRWVKQSKRVGRYLRYMDDMVLWGDYELLHVVKQEAPKVFGYLGLSIKRGGELNRCGQGVPFLGFVLYPNRTRLNRSGRRRLRRKWKDVERAFESGKIDDLELQSRTKSLFAHAEFGNDVGWRREVIRFSRLRESQEPATRAARRVVEQHGE